MNATETKVAKKSKAHQKYFVKDGTQVPGCTTVTGVMDKSGALTYWAWNLGMQQIDFRTFRDELATIGTLAHYFIECYLLGCKAELGDYTENQIEAAKKCFMKFTTWMISRNVKKEDFAVTEGQLVSEKHRFGGTIDIAAVVNGVPTLIDIKTSKAVYGEMKTQVAGGYRLLCEEAGYGVEQTIILRIGRDDKEGFEEITVGKEESDLHVKRFLTCLELYKINKQIGK
jgi:hypothetical protein